MLENYKNVFTPGSPPKWDELLVGRQHLQEDIQDYLESPGFHPVIVGNRGVGKTSLIKAAAKDFDCVEIEVNTVPSFDALCREVCEEVGIDIRQQSVKKVEETTSKLSGRIVVGGELSGTKSAEVLRVGDGEGAISPRKFYRLLKQHPGRLIIILDEFETLPRDSDIRRNIVAFIKGVANKGHEFPHKIVIVGIAVEMEYLIGLHKSAERNIREVYVGPLDDEVLVDFIDRAAQHAGVAFAPEIKQVIAREACGYPYYVHLVGYYCCRAMLRRISSTEARVVSNSDFLEAKKEAAESSFRSILSRYKNAVYSLTPFERRGLQEYFRLARRTVGCSELIHKLVSKGIMNDSECTKVLFGLKKKGIWYFIGQQRTIHFSEPLLIPFLRLRLSEDRLEGRRNKKQLELNFENT